jgi:hypothetical protein
LENHRKPPSPLTLHVVGSEGNGGRRNSAYSESDLQSFILALFLVHSLPLTTEPAAVVKSNKFSSPVRRSDLDTVTWRRDGHNGDTPAQNESPTDQLLKLMSRRDDGHTDDNDETASPHAPFTTEPEAEA